MYNMKLKGATTVLKKECVFLGLTMSALFTMIKRNPMAFPNRTLLAYKSILHRRRNKWMI